MQSPKVNKKTTARSWLYLILISLACVFVSRKVPTPTTWLDTLTGHPELSTRVFSVERDVEPLQVTETSVNSTGLTDEVQWDEYSLLLRGQRIFLQ